MEPEPLTVTLAGFRAATGLGRSTAYKLINAGEIERVSIAGRTLITYRSVKAYIDRHLVEAGAPRQ